MNDVPEWLKRLNSSRSGLWSIVCPTGSSFQAESLVASSPRDVEAVFLSITRDADSLTLRHETRAVRTSEIKQLLASCERDATEAGRCSIRVLIGNFHEAPTDVQCALIKSARGIQETATQVSWQFVFCGRWSYYAFRAAYLEIHGHTSSPPAHSKDVLQPPVLTADDVLALLSDRRLMAAYPSEIERIAAEYLIEQTAGDEFLIGEAIHHLEQIGHTWTAHIEQVVVELAQSSVIIDAVSARLHSLDVNARSELDKLLRVQRLIRNIDSIEAEQLWLAGLARRRDLGSGKQCVHLAGPLTNIILRRILHIQSPGSVALPEDLCFEREAIAAAAYRKISQIEIMLRNLVVAFWYAEAGDKWTERLVGIKTLSRDQEEAEDVPKLTAELVWSKLVAIGLAPQELPKDETQHPHPRKERRKESILESASDWQNRQRNHHAVELSCYNLMQFLTTEALMSILVNKRDGLHGHGKPFSRKEYLVTALEEYIAIRSAVAHNQSMKLSTILRLDDLHRRFVEWLTVYADEPTPASVPESKIRTE